MLVQFMVKNVLSFKEETILDMTAINAYKEHESNLIDNGTKEKYLYGLAKDFEELNIDSYEISSDLPNEHGGYKIAFYLSFNDFHFLRQNSDGSWSHKVGYLNRIDKFDTLPNIVNGNYELIKVLEIVKPKVR